MIIIASWYITKLFLHKFKMIQINEGIITCNASHIWNAKQNRHKCCAICFNDTFVSSLNVSMWYVLASVCACVIDERKWIQQWKFFWILCVLVSILFSKLPFILFLGKKQRFQNQNRKKKQPKLFSSKQMTTSEICVENSQKKCSGYFNHTIKLVLKCRRFNKWFYCYSQRSLNTKPYFVCFVCLFHTHNHSHALTIYLLCLIDGKQIANN